MFFVILLVGAVLCFFIFSRKESIRKEKTKIAEDERNPPAAENRLGRFGL